MERIIKSERPLTVEPLATTASTEQMPMKANFKSERPWWREPTIFYYPAKKVYVAAWLMERSIKSQRAKAKAVPNNAALHNRNIVLQEMMRKT